MAFCNMYYVSKVFTGENIHHGQSNSVSYLK